MADTYSADPSFDDRFSDATHPAPYAPPAAPAPPPGPQRQRPDFDFAIGAAQNASRDAEQAFQQQQQVLQPRREHLTQSLDQPIPMPPAPQKVADAPNPQDFQKNSMAFAGAMALLGAIGSKFGRMSGMAALSSFNGALKGWQDGNLQAYEQAAKQWEQNTKKTIENNAFELQQYKAILENKKMNIDQQMSAIQMQAAQFHDKMMFDASQAKNFTMVAQLYQRRDKVNSDLQLSYDKLSEHRNDQAERAKSSVNYWMNHPEEYEKLTPEQKQSIQQLMQIHKLGFAPSAGDATGGQGESGSLTPDTIKQMVDRRLAGDKTVLQNIGRGAQGAYNVTLFNNALATEMASRKMTGADLAKVDQRYMGENAYQRTAGTQGANVENAANEVVQVIPQALETSRRLPRGQLVPLNQLVQEFQKGTSKPEYNDFIMANFALINAYTRAMNPRGVPRIQERLEQRALGILSTATSPQAYEVQVSRLWKEVQASKTAVAKTAEGRTPGDINAPVPQPEGGPGPSGAPAVGHTEDGYRFKGGNPADKNNWEKM